VPTVQRSPRAFDLKSREGSRLPRKNASRSSRGSLTIYALNSNSSSSANGLNEDISPCSPCCLSPSAPRRARPCSPAIACRRAPRWAGKGTRRALVIHATVRRPDYEPRRGHGCSSGVRGKSCGLQLDPGRRRLKNVRILRTFFRRGMRHQMRRQ